MTFAGEDLAEMARFAQIKDGLEFALLMLGREELRERVRRGGDDDMEQPPTAGALAAETARAKAPSPESLQPP